MYFTAKFWHLHQNFFVSIVQQFFHQRTLISLKSWTWITVLKFRWRHYKNLSKNHRWIYQFRYSCWNHLWLLPMSFQKLLHPDKFTLKTQKEKQFSEEISSLVNISYSTLMSPLQRGIYILKLKGTYWLFPILVFEMLWRNCWIF